jgi:TolB-like protein
MGSFFAELKRRRVYRVAIVYAAVAFVIWQIAEIAVPGLDLPDWTLTFVILLTLLGFPIALVLAWAFEITPEGVKRTEPLAEGAARPGPGNRAIAATAAIVVLVLAVAVAWLVIRDGGPAPSTARKSIAVLPFDNLSNDPEADEYFAEGVHDEIIAYLSKIGDLKVTSRTSVMRYKDTGMSLRDIAAQLDVATILEGAVRRADDRVRIAVRLIDAHADEQLWAEIYERDYADIFAIQLRQSDRALRGCDRRRSGVCTGLRRARGHLQSACGLLDAAARRGGPTGEGSRGEGFGARPQRGRSPHLSRAHSHLVRLVVV